MSSNCPSTDPHILIVDDEESICRAFQRFFEKRQWNVDVAATGEKGIDTAAADNPDLVFLDVRLPDGDGLQMMERFRELQPDLPVVIMTAYGGMDTVLEAVRGGAFDYLPKPIDLDRAFELAQRAVASHSGARPDTGSVPESDDDDLIGSSKSMQKVFRRVAQVARSNGSVLILGQTGTGKELIARAIHRHSGRSDGPFVAVNCAAIPDNLVESELFGCVPGAFTGAEGQRTGRFEAADGGTLLLDEVGELPPPSQAKLLRVLDSQVFERVGSVEPVPVDVRILAATNSDLNEQMEANNFRADFYYRLAAHRIELPPLADRKEDILSLARHFLRTSQPTDSPDPVLTPDAAEALLAYSWPGNVREMENAMKHALTVAPTATIRPDDLPNAVTSASSRHDLSDELAEAVTDYINNNAQHGEWHTRTVAVVEKTIIRHALRRCDGNQSQAADLLGLHRNTLRNKIRDLDIHLA
jgi:two-component system nitrogen regulation response regulator GlnG